jgi:hypothetical protein
MPTIARVVGATSSVLDDFLVNESRATAVRDSVPKDGPPDIIRSAQKKEWKPGQPPADRQREFLLDIHFALVEGRSTTIKSGKSLDQPYRIFPKQSQGQL